MTRRIFCKVLLVAVAVFGLLALSGILLAQGRSDWAFERVKEVQERHTKNLMAKPGVVGTAIGLNDNGRHVVMILLEKPGVPGIPNELEGVPVRQVVTGKIYALKPPTNRPPKPPRALTATAVGTNRIDLDWKDSREPAVIGYKVYRSQTSGSGYVYIDSSDVSNYSDITLAAGTTYYYVVRAVTSTQESGYSNEASATTEPAPPEPPTAPSNLTATAAGSTQIDLTWTDNADNETGFKIERKTDGSFSEITTVGANVTSYSDTTCEPSTTYTYRVCAYNDSGNSPYSNEASDTTEPAPPETPTAPSNLTATAAGSTQIDLTWTDNADNETGFKIERDSVQIDTVSANVTSYSDATCEPSTTYTYRVCAYNDSGNSGYSNEASATTESAPIEPPAAPSNLTATAAGSSQIDLTWTDNADNETGFKIERKSGTDSFSEIATVSANVTGYSDATCAPSTTYTYQICAYNESGGSPYSNEASATTGPDSEPVVDRMGWCTRPVPIGVSTGHPDITAGTIGCRVTKSGQVYALSNNHVYADENLAGIGDAVIQPGTFDGGTSPADDIGTLAEYEDILYYPWGLNTIDAAIAFCSTDTLGKSTPSDGYGTPSSTTAGAYLGQAVKKYGRTTGLTHGVVDGVNAAVLVQYSRGFAIFVNQIIIIPGGFSSGGDSGSLIVTDDSNCNPVGLLFAGSSTSTIANPIDLVLSRFGVSVDGQ